VIFADGSISPTSAFLQYGSFGLLALFFVWFMWKGAPMLLDRFERIIAGIIENAKATITKLVDDFKTEAEECREERSREREDRKEGVKVMSEMKDAIGKLTERLDKD
jgi:F0F1-type ATP synthase membrane subunit b/b'